MHVEGACLVEPKSVPISMRAQGSHRHLQASDFMSASILAFRVETIINRLHVTRPQQGSVLSLSHMAGWILYPGLQMSSSHVMSELQCPAQRTLCSACLYLGSLVAPFWTP